MVVRSKLLSNAGFAHGFTGATGGVSGAPFDVHTEPGAALNLARNLGDDPAAVAENHRRVAEGVGYVPELLYEVSQVHGDTVVKVGRDDDVQAVRATEADALVTADGCVLGVRIADCLPLLLAHPRTGAVAAVHCGWRSTEARIVDRALEKLRTLGAPSAEVIAAIGPHIRVASFEVGQEVAAKISAQAHGESVVDHDHPKPHVDLAKTVTAQLRAAGVKNVDDVGGDTLAQPWEYFSYRRDGERAGRQIAVIVGRTP